MHIVTKKEIPGSRLHSMRTVLVSSLYESLCIISNPLQVLATLAFYSDAKNRAERSDEKNLNLKKQNNEKSNYNRR